MNNYKCKMVNVSDIDINDCRFKISDDSNVDSIEYSIKEIGLLNPPILIKNIHYSIISGFKRVLVCKKIGIKKIRAIIIDKDEAVNHCYKIAISDNSTQRKLSFNEIIKSIRLIDRYVTDEINSHDKIRLLSNLLDMHGNYEYISKLLKISTMKEKLISLINENRISISVAYEISSYSETIVDLICDIFSKMDISQNSQKEMINLVFEISLKERINPEIILKDILGFLKNFQGDGYQVFAKIINVLKERRYPLLSDYKSKFEKGKNNFLIDRNVSIQIQKEFEELSFQLKIIFKDAPELFNRCQRIFKYENNKEFIALFGY